MNFLAIFLQNQPSLPPAAQQALAIVAPIFMIVGLVCLAIIILPFWFICKKAGFSPWLSLLVIVPFGFLILLYVLAFAQWKVAPAPQMTYPPPYPQPPMPPQA